jgi:hypothetical protein
MATYKQIQEYIKNKHGVTVKTCWIAHVKEMNNIVTRVSPNRISNKNRLYPCPKKYIADIEEAFSHFGMI